MNIDIRLDLRGRSFRHAQGWTLLTDGVFASRPRQVRGVVNSLCTEQNIPVLLGALRRREIVPLPELPRLPVADGPDPTWTRLTEQITANPGNPKTRRRVQALRELLNQRTEFTKWWAEQIRATINGPAEGARMEMTARCEGAAGIVLDLDGIDLSRPLVAQRVLNTGLVPPSGSKFEADLIQAVLDGRSHMALSFSLDRRLARSNIGLHSPCISGHRRASRRLSAKRLHNHKSDLSRTVD